MRPEIVSLPGISPLVPPGADASSYVVARAARGTLGTMKIGARDFVPSVAAAPGAMARAAVAGGGGIAGALAVAGPVAALAGLGVGVFNGVMSWKMNKKLNTLISEQRAISEQLQYGFADLGSTVLSESARISTELQQVHHGVAQQLEEIRLHQLQQNALELLQLQLMCFDAALALHDVGAPREAENLDRIGAQLKNRARAEVAVFQPSAEGTLQLTLVEVQGLLAQSDAEFAMAARDEETRERRLARAAVHRLQARNVVRDRLVRSVEAGFYELRDQDIPMFARYWAVLQGLDVTVGVVAQNAPQIADLHWDPSAWRELAGALDRSTATEPDYELFVPATHRESVSCRRLMAAVAEGAPTGSDVNAFLGVPEGRTLPFVDASVALTEVEEAAVGLLDPESEDLPVLQGSGEALAEAWPWPEFLGSAVDQFRSGNGSGAGDPLQFDLSAMRRDARLYLLPDDETRGWIECLATLDAVGPGETAAGADVEVLESARRSSDTNLSLIAAWCLAATHLQGAPSLEAAAALERFLRHEDGVRRLARIARVEQPELERLLRRWLRFEHRYLITYEPERARSLWRSFRARTNAPQQDVHEAHFRENHCAALSGPRPKQALQEMRTRRKRYAQDRLADPEVLREMDRTLSELTPDVAR